MKTLLILRHAKSSRDNPGLVDHERPLKLRGERDAPHIGRLIADEELVPDRILSSTATRARQTAELVAADCGYRGEIAYRGDLYLARPASYGAALCSLPDECSRVLVVGHNPGLEEWLEQLVGSYERLPTAALAVVELDVDRWSDLDADSRGRLLQLWRPRELD